MTLEGIFGVAVTVSSRSSSFHDLRGVPAILRRGQFFIDSRFLHGRQVDQRRPHVVLARSFGGPSGAAWRPP